MKYFPEEVGVTEEEYWINLVNWDNKYVVSCKGICEIPRIDTTPEVIFPLVYEIPPVLEPVFCAYFYNEDAFNFGQIIFLQTYNDW